MENKAVSDTGPIIRLAEINLVNALKIFSSIFICDEVLKELRKNKVILPSFIKICNLLSNSKDSVKVLTNQYNLDLGEAQAISLAIQEKIDIFLTDDLDARSVARSFNLEVHGTIGIVLRSYREKIIDKKTAVEKIQNLKRTSSLFITEDLIREVIKSIEEFKK